MGEWLYRSKFSWPRHYLEVSGQLDPTGLELGPLGRPARSQLLYRLRYPGSGIQKLRTIISYTVINVICVFRKTTHACSIIFLMGWDWVHLVLQPLFGLLYQPQMIEDDDDCGAVGRMRIGRGNRSTRRKPAPVALRPQQIPHDLTQAQIRVAPVGNKRLTSWAMARLLHTRTLC
jgi:hypothetical protein